MAVLPADLVDRVAEIIPRYNMLSAGNGVGVGVSGGADSVALLHILDRLASKLKIKLIVLHVNHQLRGAESDDDERFVCRLAGVLQLPIAIEQAPIESGNLEQEARRARREFFHRAMREHRLNRIALGHTGSDQAETVLFRLLRGSGLAGLAGMQPVSPEGLIRPLLTSSRAEVRAWAQAHRIEWREDSSNRDPRFVRNRLRNEAIPFLTDAFNPNLEGVLARNAELAQDEECYWNQQIDRIYPQIAKRNCFGIVLDVSAFSGLHTAIRRRIIRHALEEVRGNLRSVEMEHVQSILDICSSKHGHDRVIVPGADALRSFNHLLLTVCNQRTAKPRHYRVEINEGIECELPFHAGSIRVDRMSQKGENCVNVEKELQISAKEVVYVDGQALARSDGRFTARNWEPGDQLQAVGHKSAQKVKSLFQEQKIPLWERRHWPVVVLGDDIVWVRGIGTAAKFSASANSGQSIRLIYVPATE